MVPNAQNYIVYIDTNIGYLNNVFQKILLYQVIPQVVCVLLKNKSLGRPGDQDLYVLSFTRTFIKIKLDNPTQITLLMYFLCVHMQHTKTHGHPKDISKRM